MTFCSTDYKYEEHKGQIPLIIHHNEKNQKYISDVKNKIVEHHKIDSGVRKVKTLKIPISTSG